MNTLKIKIPLKFLLTSVNVTWDDIIFGVKNEYLVSLSVSEYAMYLLEKNDEDLQDEIINLAWGDKNDIDDYIYNYLRKSNVNTETVKDKFLYVLLKLVWENKNDYTDPLEVIENLYADLGYPSEIDYLVRYMPMKHKDMGSIELNVAEMYKDWEAFLMKKSKKYL
ncbi:DUF2247 family protein [Listeria sp. FSL L7-1699]|uniref:DUF2247 family protein n=1 Tax=Listeria farberi TaxID=2713500 RepID=A0ABR6SKH2_9LIST|nr:DUF2247 family protein [Listeria farberi]MBC1374586.1 DUF2247 family protein [Listeria farberi]MBC1380826.1 DUF2247 family protein [Listeria farberi]